MNSHDQAVRERAARKNIPRHTAEVELWVEAHGTDPDAVKVLWDEVAALEAEYNTARVEEPRDKARVHDLGLELSRKRQTLKGVLVEVGLRTQDMGRVEEEVSS